MPTNEPISVASLGEGYDTFQGQPRSLAIDASPDNIIVFNPTRSAQYMMCQDVSQLYKALNISASIAGSFAFIDKISDKVTYFQSLLTTTYSVSVVVYASYSVQSKLQTYRAARDVAFPTTREQAERFFEYYGDSFVAQLQKGGEFIYTYTFFAYSYEEQQKITNTLKLNGIDEAGTLSADFDLHMTNALAQIQTSKSINWHMQGFKDVNSAPEQGKIYEYANNLLFQHQVNPDYVLDFEVVGFEHAVGFDREAFAGIIYNRQCFNTGFETGEPSLVLTRAMLMHLQNALKDILEMYNAYGVTVEGQQLLKDRNTIVADEILGLEMLINQVETHPASPILPPDLVSLTWGTPEPHYVPLGIIRWGSDNGEYFEDVVHSMAQGLKRIYKLQLGGSGAVTQLITTYIDKGGETVTLKHGTDFNAVSPILTLMKEGDRALKITVYVRQTVLANFTYMVFEFLSDTLAWPPDGPQGAQRYSFEFKANQALVGFQGRVDKNPPSLDQLGLVVVEFVEATWNPFKKTLDGQRHRNAEEE